MEGHMKYEDFIASMVDMCISYFLDGVHELYIRFNSMHEV